MLTSFLLWRKWFISFFISIFLCFGPRETVRWIIINSKVWKKLHTWNIAYSTTEYKWVLFLSPWEIWQKQSIARARAHTHTAPQINPTMRAKLHVVHLWEVKRRLLQKALHTVRLGWQATHHPMRMIRLFGISSNSISHSTAVISAVLSAA